MASDQGAGTIVEPGVVTQPVEGIDVAVALMSASGALIVVFALVLLSLSRSASRLLSVQDQVAALDHLPEADRRLALVSLLKVHRADRYQEHEMDAERLKLELLRD